MLAQSDLFPIQAHEPPVVDIRNVTGTVEYMRFPSRWEEPPTDANRSSNRW